MWKYFVLCFFALGWAFFELSGGQDFEPQTITPAVNVSSAAEVAEVIDREFDVENVAQAASTALRDINFDHSAELVTRADTFVPNQLWKVSTGSQLDSTIINDLDEIPMLSPDETPDSDNIYTVAVNRANMRNGPSTRNGVVAKLERGTAVQVLPSQSGQWVKLRVVDTNRVGWISKTLLAGPD